jgi:hypothetical protein
MSTGYSRAEALPSIEPNMNEAEAVDPLPRLQPDFIGEPVEEVYQEDGRESRPALAMILIVLALAWIAACAWSVVEAGVPTTVAHAVQLIGLASGPLVLLAAVWLIFGHATRRETDRFRQAVAELRAEGQALDSVLAIVGSRLEENHSRLTKETANLMALGDEASDRLGRVTYYLSKESKTLDRQSHALEAAAANARVDLGVLLADLPRAEEEAKAMAATLRKVGLEAHAQAGALDGQLASLIANGRQADEVVGGAAQRLGAQLVRIESSAAAAGSRLDEAASGMTASVDTSLGKAAIAIDEMRSSLDAQGSAMLALLEQNRSAMAEAGDEAARSLFARLENARSALAELANGLAEQDVTSQHLISRLDGGLASVAMRLTSVRETGEAETGVLLHALETVAERARSLTGELAAGDDRAGGLAVRIDQIAGEIGAVIGQLTDDVPGALARIDDHAERTRELARSLLPEVAAVESSAGRAANQLAEAETSVARQQEAIGSLLARIVGSVSDAEARLAAVRDASTALAGQLDADLESVDARFESIKAAGDRGAIHIRESFAAVQLSSRQVFEDLDAGQQHADALVETLRGLDGSLVELLQQLTERAPAALSGIEERAGQARATAAAIAPELGALEGAAASALAKLEEAEASLERQRRAIDALLAQLDEGSANASEQLRGIGEASSMAERSAAKLVSSTGPELVEALLRVRETATLAADRAREAIGAVIPESAARLAEASRAAISAAVTGSVQSGLGELNEASETALVAARSASERLTRQLLGISEAAAAVERRIEEAQRVREERDADSLARHLALLIESLNSTAIDVTKILSNDVTDNAWTAYLKGDRGVFTRRAVRLLDHSEAREILRHYDEEPEFREQVNRYIHDFEAMMRRILADRDSSPLGVTILSSDMGKLYVALAQAIERLRV